VEDKKVTTNIVVFEKKCFLLVIVFYQDIALKQSIANPM
jgi:hypothetical protein